ncbi:tRNA uridine-5-carboxymethylaminomethyl(34) synthesis GTPase MnmE [Halochromatium roseum]|uniref:tRNA uridine-5-carboxymethylaminomethyl(34) synthesis GTPase MnmE n=1 Tax=Halochromatium roseum TaxID=391920 RepID=UPI001912051D|nr:tRNA uridine-5-carboxymethylaminomethyl(34) synthesis GTPase MnmE [Halochromatium roseum]MBK5937958.1 tRNA uridine-5-carboxymethylaminomethyl(34) synthesis GTPase MnmE [Halochromatium roseum]
MPGSDRSPSSLAPEPPASSAPDTIAAVATAPGVGAIGILRISGPAAERIAEHLIGSVPQPRQATLRRFVDAQGEAIDQGVALWFPAPHSFTGENLLELQGHGGPIVLDLLLARALDLGARPARPGEFSERAFLNGKLDLAQAEAIADLIQAGTATQARLATRSLQGVFSRRVNTLVEQLTRLRALIEAALDFPDDELDALPISDTDFATLIAAIETLLASSHQGELIRDGLLVVIAGAPNAGKSSLLNALAGTEAAIVTEIPGTTRDLLRAEIQIDGLPLRLVDTAGLRPSTDPVEQEGIRRARGQIQQADHLLLIIDDHAQRPDSSLQTHLVELKLDPGVPVTILRNKIDRSGRPIGKSITPEGHTELACSAKTGAGLDDLRSHLKTIAGYRGADAGEFSARRRHVEALRQGLTHLKQAQQAWAEQRGHRHPAPELVAEDLRLAQYALGEITGEFSSDDLLGRIFSEFCIGK